MAMKAPAPRNPRARAKTSPPPPPVAHRYLSGNAFVCGDNLDILRELPAESVDLIYLDPPFNSNHNYVAVFGDKGSVDAQLRDIWHWNVESETQYQRLQPGPLRNAIDAIRMVSGHDSSMAAYALFMGRRLAEMHRVLKKTGSIYLHCDDAASHYLRIVMDAVFGEANMRNVLVWRRATSHNDAGQRYGRIADHILFYAKSARAYWNGGDASTVKDDDALRAAYPSKDKRGRYRADNLTGPRHNAERKSPSTQPWHGYDVYAMNRVWSAPRTGAYADYIEEHFIPGYKSIDGVHDRLDALDEAGLIHHPVADRNGKKGKWPGLKRYADADAGNPPQNIIWNPTGFTNFNKRLGEYIGYPTQKPLGLLEQLLLASCPPGGLMLDPFCGCGTAADAAAKLGRGYLGIDVSAIAVRVMEQRLTSRTPDNPPVVYKMGWEDYEWDAFEQRALMLEADAEDGQPGWAWAEDKVAGLLNAVSNSKKRGDGGVDARYYTAAGEELPIQVKMHKGQIGRPELDKLLGVQASWNNQKIKAPMSVMVTLYQPSQALKTFAAKQGQVTLRGERYPKMQVLSVWEMLTKDVRPKLPPVAPFYFVGETQTRMSMAV